MRLFYPRAHALLGVVFDGFAGPAADSPRMTIPVRPMSARIHRVGYTQPDAWDLQFDANDFPVDPQLIRAGSVDLWLYQTDGLADERIVGAPGQDQPIRPPSIAGLFDRAGLVLGEDGKTVRLRGQDYTALLMQRRWNRPGGAGRRVPTGQTLTQTLTVLLREADPSGTLALAPRGVDADPVVGAGETRNLRRGIPVGDRVTYWDVMTRVATRYGYVLFVDGYDVVLARPQSLNDAKRIRRMAWGRNIESMSLERNLGKEKVPRVVVRGYDARTRRNLWVEYPPRAQRIPIGAIGVSEDEYEVIPTWFSDERLMRAIARARFEALGRTERRVVLQTKDLRTETAGGALADLLETRAGDAFVLEVAEVSPELLSDPRIPEARKLSALLEKGYDARVAAIIARSFAQGQPIVDRPLRVNEATIDLGDDGVSIEVELLDFIAVDGIREGA